ncbi:probable peptidylglycine alpha-hydroxylating monooxygenase 1 [Anneissia japonica]|uniref:probable peptidylglycine alpha-hydroxylating monooxygenase 1 n=1 Tax=Anneissia japonica TaxID=1529436 RepID=UPI0014257672|nr:probable peptidylglycine alpha-hydroxylating monooxygenase 1 [Anneissia japonica]
MAKASFFLFLIVSIIGLQQVISLTQSQVNYLKQRLNDRFNLPVSDYSQFSEFSETKNEIDSGASIQNEYDEERTINEKSEEHSHTIDVDIRMPDVKPTYENEYFCHAIEMPMERSVFIVGYKPHAEMGTAHHMLLYGCSEPGSQNKSWNCGEMATTNDESVCGDGPRILYAWAMDAPSLELPKDVGFEVGGDTGINYLVLQVHYGDISEKIKEHFTDDSGITLQITDQPRKLSAAVYLLGSGGYIPGHSEVYMESACSYDHSQVLHPFAYRVHTHKLGRVVSGYRIRNQQWEEIGRRDPQKPEMFYPITKNMTVERGDILAARCTMVNDMDKTVYTGATSDDEMCNFYMMYYTEGTLPNIDTCFRANQFKWRHYFDNIPADASVVPDEK